MKKIVIGMSGGVDSSVAAYLLKQQGYDVIGVTMQIWQDETQYDEDGCSGIVAVDDAKKIADRLEIPHYVVNFKDKFKKQVMDYFVEEYLQGRTPNPCLVCNRYIKWEALIEEAKKLGADYIATGHYARIDRLENGRYAIKTSATSKKDQTYALYALTQEQLKRTLMPVGEYTKDEIRIVAADIGLEVANKPDSQDICFIPDMDYAKFVVNNTNKQINEGNFINLNNEVIARHKGIIYYTVGQRKGLQIGKKMYVLGINPDTNEVVVGNNEDLFKTTVYANKLNFMSREFIDGDVRAFAKIRYSHSGAACTVRMIDKDLIECIFDEPQRAITPGQALVVYDKEYVMVGGTIINYSN